jgi:hemolysin III
MAGPSGEMIEHLFAERPQSGREEFWNALTSGAGALAALVGGVFLLPHAGSPPHVAATMVYIMCLVALHATSAAYHATNPASPAKNVWQKLDHCAIFTLIAGTYTPFAAIGIGGWTGSSLLALQWATAAIGCALQFAAPRTFRKASTALYVFMGWGGLLFWPALKTNLPPETMAGMIAGGIAYTAGVAFYATKGISFFHVTWHLFVLAGSAIHFVTIWQFLSAGSSLNPASTHFQ